MVSVQESFDNFIVSRLLADLAERSIKDYREFMAPFVRFVGSERDLGTIEQKDIDGYIFTLLESRVDIYSLMYIMGHENIETTRRYLHLAMEIVASKESIFHLDGLFL